MKKNKIIGAATAAAFGVMVALQPINVLNQTPDMAFAASKVTFSSAQKTLISTIEAKVKLRASSAKNIEINGTKTSWENLKKDDAKMKTALSAISKNKYFIVMNGSARFKYHTSGRLMYDNTDKKYNETEQTILYLVNDKMKVNKTDGKVYVKGKPYTWESYKSNTSKMKSILAEIKAANSFTVSNGSAYAKYNLSGTKTSTKDASIAAYKKANTSTNKTTSNNSSTSTKSKVIVKADTSKLTSAEKKIFNTIESKRIAAGDSNNMQIGKTSFNWKYYTENAEMLKIAINYVIKAEHFKVSKGSTLVAYTPEGKQITGKVPHDDFDLNSDFAKSIEKSVKGEDVKTNEPVKETNSKFTAEENRLIELIEGKRSGLGVNDNIQVGNTSYPWRYAYLSDPDYMKGILSDVIALKHFKVVASNLTYPTFDLQGNEIEASGNNFPFGKPDNFVSFFDRKIAEYKANHPEEQSDSTDNVASPESGNSSSSNDSSEKETANNNKDSHDIDSLKETLESIIENPEKDSDVFANAAKVNSEIAKLISQFQKGDITEEAFNARMEVLSKQVDELAKLIEKNTKDIATNKSNIDKNAKELETQKGLLAKLSETLDGLINSLDSLLSVIKGLFGIK